jgi:hypothetical protein
MGESENGVRHVSQKLPKIVRLRNDILTSLNGTRENGVPRDNTIFP